MNPREQVLRNIRGAINARKGRAGSSVESDAALADANPSGADYQLPAAVSEYLDNRGNPSKPSLGEHTDMTDRLLDQMQQVQITVTRLQTSREVPAAVQEYLQEHGIDGSLIVSPALSSMDWPADTLQGVPRAAAEEGTLLTSVTPCLCAVAETGSVVTLSGDATPNTLNFLPDNHVVVIHQDQIVNHMEDAWKLQRDSQQVPRALNFLTGPSRTADIEQTLELGAHGPRRMHVLLVAESRR